MFLWRVIANNRFVFMSNFHKNMNPEIVNLFYLPHAERTKPLFVKVNPKICLYSSFVQVNTSSVCNFVLMNSEKPTRTVQHLFCVSITQTEKVILMGVTSICD